MKRMVTICLVVLALLCTFLLPGPTHAQGTRAMTTTACWPNPCQAYASWGPHLSLHGAATTVETSTPNYGGTGNNFDKDLAIVTGAGYIDIGQESNNGGTVSCGSGNYYYYEVNDSGASARHCFPVPSGDDNKDVLFKVSYYASNGGGWFIWIQGNGGYLCTPTPCTYNTISDSYSSSPVTTVTYTQTLANSSFSGHAIWGTDWINNQYFFTSWNYWNSASSISLYRGDGGNPPPPQMYWNSNPNGSLNNGGSLYSCDYETGTSCTIGS